MVLEWEAWSPMSERPSNLKLLEFFPLPIETGPSSGPSSMAALTVRGLGLTVVAHRKAADSHLLALGELSLKVSVRLFCRLAMCVVPAEWCGAGLAQTVAASPLWWIYQTTVWLHAFL